MGTPQFAYLCSSSIRGQGTKGSLEEPALHTMMVAMITQPGSGCGKSRMPDDKKYIRN